MQNKNNNKIKREQENILISPEEEPEENPFIHLLHVLSPQQLIVFLLLLTMLIIAIILGVHAVNAKKNNSTSEIRETVSAESILPSTDPAEDQAIASLSPEVSATPAATSVANSVPTPVVTPTPAISASTAQVSSSSVSTATYYTVTFDSNGGSPVASVQVKAGDRVSEPSAPTRDGFRFTGWYVNVNHTAAYYFDRETVRRDITLFAGWESNTTTSADVPEDMMIATPSSTQVTAQPTSEPASNPEITQEPVLPDEAEDDMNQTDSNPSNTEATDAGQAEEEPAPIADTDDMNVSGSDVDAGSSIDEMDADSATAEPIDNSAIILSLNASVAAQPETADSANTDGTLSANTISIPANIPVSEGIPDDLSSGSYALINSNGVFLSIGGNNIQLSLSGTPVFWNFSGNSNAFSIQQGALENGFIGYSLTELRPGTIVTCNNAQNPGTTWALSEANDGYIIVSADQPELCLLAGEKGFFLGPRNLVSSNDIWHFVNNGDWVNDFTGSQNASYNADDPSLSVDQAVSSSDDVWAGLYSNGIEEDSVTAAVSPILMQPTFGDVVKADTFTVDFYTGSQPDNTDWTLSSWTMDTTEFMNRNGYTAADTKEATAGLRVSQDGPCAFLNMPSVTFTADDKDALTLTPTCTYPTNSSDGLLSFGWQADTWYRIVIRSWTHTETETTYVGFWIQNLSNDEVTLLAIYDTHLPQSCLTGTFSMRLACTDNLSGCSYAEMQVGNLRLRDAETQAWTFVSHMTMTNENTAQENTLWRFSASSGVFRAEISGTTVAEGTYEPQTMVLLSAHPASAGLDLAPFTALGMQGSTDSAS